MRDMVRLRQTESVFAVLDGVFLLAPLLRSPCELRGFHGAFRLAQDMN